MIIINETYFINKNTILNPLKTCPKITIYVRCIAKSSLFKEGAFGK